MRRPSGVATFGCSLAVLALLGLGWQLAVTVAGIPEYNLPSPMTTLGSLTDNRALLAQRSLSTLLGAGAGLLVAVGSALSLALFVVRFPALTRAVTGYALVVRTLPIVGVAPLITLVAGRGLTTSVLCVGIVTVFALYVAAVEGLQHVPGPVGDLAQLYGSSFARTTLHAWLPSAWGGLVAGLRIAGPLAVLAAVLAEWLSGWAGVGSLMTTAQSERDLPLLWAATVTAAVLGLGAYALPGLLAGLAARRGLSPEVVEL